jgi:hypothetical protein
LVAAERISAEMAFHPAAAASIDSEPGPEYILAELTSGGNPA